MKPYRDVLTQLLLRALLALPLAAVGWYLVGSIGSGWAAAPVLLVAMGCFIGAAVVVAGPLTRLFAEPAGALYHPPAAPAALTPDYGVADALKDQTKSREAFGEYRKIADVYPQEVKPYVEMMDIALKNMKDEALARDVLTQGLARLREAADQETLNTMFQMGIWETFGAQDRKH